MNSDDLIAWHKARVEQALDEYEEALNAYEIWMAKWKLKHWHGIEQPDEVPRSPNYEDVDG